MIPAIFGILGVLAGAIAQFLLARIASQDSKRTELRTAAYVHYLSSVAQATMSKADIDKSRADILEAKFRILIYGHPDVIAAMANFELRGAIVKTPEDEAAFLKIVHAMRSTATSLPAIESSHTNAIVFNRLRGTASAEV